MTRARSTEQTWPDETPEQVLERLRASDPVAARILEKQIASPPPRNLSRDARLNHRSGVKPKPPVSWAQQTRGGVSWRERSDDVVQLVRTYTLRRQYPKPCGECGQPMLADQEAAILARGAYQYRWHAECWARRVA